VGGLSGSEKALIRFSAGISRTAEGSVAESRSRLNTSGGKPLQCEKSSPVMLAGILVSVGRPPLTGIVI